MAQNNAETPNLSGGEGHTTTREQESATTAPVDQNNTRHHGGGSTSGEHSDLGDPDLTIFDHFDPQDAVVPDFVGTSVPSERRLRRLRRDLRREERRARRRFDPSRPYRNTSLQEVSVPEMSDDDSPMGMWERVRGAPGGDNDDDDDDDEEEIENQRRSEATYEAEVASSHLGIVSLGPGSLESADGEDIIDATAFAVAIPPTISTVPQPWDPSLSPRPVPLPAGRIIIDPASDREFTLPPGIVLERRPRSPPRPN